VDGYQEVSGSGKKEQKDTTAVVYTRRPNETYEEYLASLETPEE